MEELKLDLTEHKIYERKILDWMQNIQKKFCQYIQEGGKNNMDQFDPLQTTWAAAVASF